MPMTSEKINTDVFLTLPDHSRVWIYQCERFLAPHEVNAINEEGNRFVAGWNAHGTPLKAKIAVLENLFLIVVADEEHAKASGCSIDKSMNFVREAENYLGASLTNRMKVAVSVDGKIIIADLNKLADLKSQGIINENSVVFDNLVATKSDLDKNWLVKLNAGWHSRFL
jgi:hypothetical protein